MMKWLMTKSAMVKVALALVALLVVGGVGTGIYLGVSNANGSSKQEIVAIDEQQAPTAESPETNQEPEKSEPETVSEGNDTAEAVEETAETVEEVRTKEGYDLVNGNFAEGLYAFEVYAMNEGDIYYDTNDNGFTVRISDTGTEDWHIQLKQSQIRLEKGRWYRLSLDAKSDINREISYTLMHNGLNDNNWTLYSPQKTISLGNGWNTYSVIFCMNEATDNDAVFNVSMGTVGGRKITSNHAVSLNNIKLEALPSNFIDSMRSGDNLISNPTFEYEDITWDANIVAPGQARVSFADNKATFAVSNPGSVDWHVQLKQTGINLEKDQCYRLTFDVTSSAARTVKVGIMDTNYVNWYGGGDVVASTEKKTVTVEFKNSIATDSNALLMISMGKIEGVDTPASTITLENFSLVKIDALSGGNGTNPTTSYVGGWEVYDHEAKHTNGSEYSVSDGFRIDIKDTGLESWHVQLTNKPIGLEKGATYRIRFEGKASIKRDITYMVQHNGNLDNKWDTYTSNNTATLTTEWQTFEQEFTMPKTDVNGVINFSLGYDAKDYLTWFAYIGEHSVWIRNISVVQVISNEPEPDGSVVIGETELNWVEKEIALADLLGDHKAEDVKGIELKGDTAFYAGYNNVKGSWTDIPESKRTTKYVFTDVDLGDNYALKVALWNTGVEHKISWRIITDASEIDNSGEEETGTFIEINNNKGEFVINPAEYGVSNPAGKTLNFKVTLKADAMFKGTIGGNDPSGWTQGPEFESSDGSEMTWEYTLEYVDYVKADIWWTNASRIEVVDVQVTVVGESEEETGTFIEINNNKGEFVINPAEYGISDPVGKKLTFKVTLKADAMFKGTIGGNDPSGWTQGPEFESADGSEMTWEYTLEYVDFVKADIWWTNASRIEVVDVQVTLAETSEEPETPAEPETPVHPEIVLAADAEPIVDEYGKKWEIRPDATEYDFASFEGKKVKVTAELQSDSYFGGVLVIQAHADYSGWNTTSQYDVDGSGNVSVWELTVEDFKQTYFQIYYRDEANPKPIVVKSLKLEVVEETPAEPEEPVAPVHSEIVLAADAEPIIDEYGKKWEIRPDAGEYDFASYAGKKVKVTAELQSDSYFGGVLVIQAHEDYSGWNTTSQYDVDGSGNVSVWELTVEDFKQTFIQIYYRDEASLKDIVLKNLTLEVVEESASEEAAVPAAEVPVAEEPAKEEVAEEAAESEEAVEEAAEEVAETVEVTE